MKLLACVAYFLVAGGPCNAFSTTSVGSAQIRYADLKDWLLSGTDDSFISPKLDIRPSTRGGLATGGYGAFAGEDIDEGEILLKIPVAKCVTLQDALEDLECGPSFANLLKKAGPGSDTVVIAGYLAKEYLLLKEFDRRISEGATADDDSEMRRLANIKFAAYLRTLPWGRGVNAQEHVLFWKDEDVDALLEGSLAYKDATETRATVKMATKVLNAIISPVIRKARAEEEPESKDEGFRFPWQQEPEPESSDEEILEGLEDAVRGAFVIMLSRSFAETVGENTQEDRLEPLLDMLQHSNAPNTECLVKGDGGSIVEVRASKVITSGDELFNRYKSEEDENMPYHKFFTRFGFVPGVVEPVADLIAARSTIFFPQRAEI
mmetsp:Transcript_29229/g.43632  ORF Transcript_29229/g.43632 Transcript_29229/m.43632 type:complete len:378 (-) Transcript_29229:17-1150(-)